MDIANKVFIVTGGASGLGAGTARMLAAHVAATIIAMLWLRQREIAGVDFDHDPARQGDEECGRSLVFAESDAPPQRAQIPIFERYGVSCRQS